MSNAFVGTIRASKSCETWEEARETLEELRAIYPEKNGYTEIKSGVKKLPNGRYRAWRKQISTFGVR